MSWDANCSIYADFLSVTQFQFSFVVTVVFSPWINPTVTVTALRNCLILKILVTLCNFFVAKGCSQGQAEIAERWMCWLTTLTEGRPGGHTVVGLTCSFLPGGSRQMALETLLRAYNTDASVSLDETWLWVLSTGPQMVIFGLSVKDILKEKESSTWFLPEEMETTESKNGHIFWTLDSWFDYIHSTQLKSMEECTIKTTVFCKP